MPNKPVDDLTLEFSPKTEKLLERFNANVNQLTVIIKAFLAAIERIEAAVNTVAFSQGIQTRGDSLEVKTSSRFVDVQNW